MDYYEELGVPVSATEEEIRKAHRRLVKLFHPDQQQDDAGKLVAETQMRRLNSLVALLTTPELRQQYDAHLKNGYNALDPETFRSSNEREFPRWRSVPWWLGSIVAAIVLSVAAIWIWAANRGNRHPTYIPPAEEKTTVPAPPISTSKTIAAVPAPDSAPVSVAANPHKQKKRHGTKNTRAKKTDFLSTPH